MRTEHTLGAAGAFAPDGSRIVVAVLDTGRGPMLRMLDAAGGSVGWSFPLDANRSLAGPGAWSPDGGRIALLAFDGCAGQTCDEAAMAARRWRLEFVDARTGRPTGTPVPVPGTPARMLGWRAGTDPVLTTAGPSSLVAVRPNGQVEVLLAPREAVGGIDVPLDLLEEGRFGGPAPRPDPFAARWEAYALLLFGAVAVLALLAPLIRRLRRRVGRLRRPVARAG